MSTTYVVEGMSCDHCVQAVRSELGELSAVSDVDVDLSTGRVTVTGDAAEDTVREAIAEAGYDVVGAE
ncbi:heavy-metal-associated domain-containing protein [Salinifilum ghardaiensis]